MGAWRGLRRMPTGMSFTLPWLVSTSTLQMAAYGPGHYYDWHVDRGQGAVAGRRKLTLSVQLTDPGTYVGGELEINADGHPFSAPRAQGTAVAFAAPTLHRVAPVVSGLRHSLVAWVHGPQFV